MYLSLFHNFSLYLSRIKILVYFIYIQAKNLKVIYYFGRYCICVYV